MCQYVNFLDMMEGNNHDNIWETPSSASDNENMHNSDNTKDFQHVRWTAIALTHVEYPKDDIFGFILAWCSLLPIFILVSFATLIIFRRDLHTISYCIGMLTNEASNWVMKHLIRQPRPIRNRVLHTEYGMPSSHSQFMWFFSTYLVFFLFIRVHQNIHLIDNIWKHLTCVGAFLVSMLVSYSSSVILAVQLVLKIITLDWVYLGYHTNIQVLCGAGAGIVLGSLWFAFVQFLLTPYFPVVASWPISEYIMLRDSTLIPNVMWFEYTSHRSEARSRQRKVTTRKSQ